MATESRINLIVNASNAIRPLQRTNDITRNAGIAELLKLEREHALHIENMKRRPKIRLNIAK